MRLTILVISILWLTACVGGTPSCTDKAIIAQVTRYAKEAISNGLRKNDPGIDTEKMIDPMNLALADITTTEHDRSIDKYSCSANILATLPPGVAALNDTAVIQSTSLAKLKLKADGDDIVAPMTYTTYRSEVDDQLILHTENDNLPARFIRIVHKIGAFDAGQRPLPDLHRGPTKYGKPEMTVLIETGKKQSLQFRVDYLKRPMCRSWMQTFTGESGDKLIYQNPKVGCQLEFSRLGELLIVAHEGCETMPSPCLPDGVYQKQ
jgi:hypothetical protein